MTKEQKEMDIVLSVLYLVALFLFYIAVWPLPFFHFLVAVISMEVIFWVGKKFTILKLDMAKDATKPS